MTEIRTGKKTIKIDDVKTRDDVIDAIDRVEMEGDERKVARFGRVDYILRSIDRVALAKLGEDQIVFVESMKDRLETGNPDNIPGVLADRLETLFMRCQPNYSLTDEQRKQVRAYCEKHGVNIDGHFPTKE